MNRLPIDVKKSGIQTPFNWCQRIREMMLHVPRVNLPIRISGSLKMFKTCFFDNKTILQILIEKQALRIDPMFITSPVL